MQGYLHEAACRAKAEDDTREIAQLQEALQTARSELVKLRAQNEALQEVQQRSQTRGEAEVRASWARGKREAEVRWEADARRAVLRLGINPPAQ